MVFSWKACIVVCMLIWRVEAAGWGCIWVKVVWRNEKLMAAEFLHGVTQSLWTSLPTSLSRLASHTLSPSLFLCSSLCFSPPPLLICLNLSMELPPPPLATSLSPPCPPPLHPPMLFQCCCLSLSNNCTPVRAQWVLLQTHPGRHTHTHAHSRHTHTYTCKHIPTHIRRV